jgi:hypothetical protein
VKLFTSFYDVSSQLGSEETNILEGSQHAPAPSALHEVRSPSNPVCPLYNLLQTPLLPPRLAPTTHIGISREIKTGKEWKSWRVGEWKREEKRAREGTGAINGRVSALCTPTHSSEGGGNTLQRLKDFYPNATARIWP